MLLFPFAVRVVVHWDVKEGKTGFVAYLYGVLRVAGGYAAPYGGGIAVHLGKKTALLLPYTQLLFSRSRFALMRGFSLCSLRQIVKIGGREDPARALAACLLWRKALDAAFFAVGRRKDVRLAGDILAGRRTEDVVARSLAYAPLYEAETGGSKVTTDGADAQSIARRIADMVAGKTASEDQ